MLFSFLKRLDTFDVFLMFSLNNALTFLNQILILYFNVIKKALLFLKFMLNLKTLLHTRCMAKWLERELAEEAQKTLVEC